MRIAIVAITRHGCAILKRLAPSLPDADLVVTRKFADELLDVKNSVVVIDGRVPPAMGGLFENYDQLLFIFSIGAAVRLIAPHLKSKEVDPGVTVIDDAAQYVIPILSGHIGGANAFADEMAQILRATAVYTTASEVQKTITVDILGRELGWQVEAPKLNLVRMAANVINNEPVAFVQECGSRAWWPEGRPLPANIHLFETIDEVTLEKYSGLLWVTNQEIPPQFWDEMAERLVVYHPPAKRQA